MTFQGISPAALDFYRELVDLGGGHWPQLTQPKALAQVILDAAR